MWTALILITVLGGASVASILHPIYLPTYMVDAFEQAVEYLVAWEGIFPVRLLLERLNLIWHILFLFVCFRFIFMLFSLLTGGGAPDPTPDSSK